MAIHYRQFMASPNDYIASSERCKIQSIRRFTSGESWMIEKDWSDEERIKLGIENDITEISEEDFIDKIGEIKDLLSEVYKEMKHE